MVTNDELKALSTNARRSNEVDRQKALDDAFLPFIHRSIEVQRKLKDPKTGESRIHNLKGIISDACWSEDRIVLVVGIVNPYTLKGSKVNMLI